MKLRLGESILYFRGNKNLKDLCHPESKKLFPFVKMAEKQGAVSIYLKMYICSDDSYQNLKISKDTSIFINTCKI